MRSTVAGPPGSSLAAYLPRLAVEWLQQAPERRHMQVDGTAVLIDVAGFTALSERLARRGRAGAEELTELLDDVFTRLLARAWDLGGQLVKFGGDALLLLFDGKGHALRACAAAHDMRAELEGTAGTMSSAGSVELRMSVGVHSGLFDFFLLGASHRELLLTGPAVSRTVAAEAAASAGEILVSRQAATALGEAGVAVPSRDDWCILARRPPAPAGGGSAVTGVSATALGEGLPAALRRYLASGGGQAEHRMTTVLFVQFMGVDELLSRQGHVPVADALEALLAATQRHVDEHGLCLLGSDVYTDGGKLIVVAGAPEASENDEERALRAVRGLLDEPLVLPLRAGVNRGHVYAGDVGPSWRRTYTVMGDAVNLAARLMQAAKPGQILVTQDVLDRSPTRFELEALDPLRVKGKARPVQAYVLGAVSGWRRKSVARLPLVGRDPEMTVLRAALESARRGSGRVVAVLGPAGMGKSRLVIETRAHAQGMRCFTVLCEQYERTSAYWPLRWLLRRVLSIPFSADAQEAGRALGQLVARVAPELLPWLPLLAIPIDAAVPPTREVDDLEPVFRRDQLDRVVVELLARLLDSPTLLLLEDLQWMDAASRSVLRKLCLEAERRPWAVLLTSREADVDVLPEGSQAIDRLRLAPLESEEAQSLARTATEHAAIPPHEVQELARRAGGSPLFLLELVAGAITSGSSVLPETIEAAITARLDALAPGDRMLLRCAAVLGVAFPAELARDALAPWAPQVHHPRSWDRLGDFLVRERDDRLRFHHALLRDVAYEGLPFRQRREIHALVAERLEAAAGERASDQAEALALHYAAAERHREACHYARLAGERARAKSANVEAAALYERALESALAAGATEDGELSALAETLGDVSELAGLYDTALRGYRAARRYARGDVARTASLLRKEGVVNDRTGRYGAARLLYRCARRLAGTLPVDVGSVRLQAEIEVLVAATLNLEGRYRASIWWARRAAALAARHDVLGVLAHAYYLLDLMFTETGQQDLAKEYRGLALHIYEDLGDLVGQTKALNNLGVNAYLEGDWHAAVGYYERGLATARRAGDLVHVAMLSTNIGEVLLQQGHLERAEELFDDALRVQRGAGHRIGEAWSTLNLGLIAARSGRLDEARALLSRARELFQHIGAESYELEAGARLAELGVLAGDHGATLNLVDRLGGQLQRLDIPVVEAIVARVRGYALLQAGHPDGAHAAFEESLGAAEAAGAIYELALTLEAMGRLAHATVGADDAHQERAELLLRDLGVVRTPHVPLPERDLGAPLRPQGVESN